MNCLKAGEKAPDFTLFEGTNQPISLSHFANKPVILVFYPADWSPVCSDQLSLYNELFSEFQRYHAEILGISVDSVWCHRAFAEQRKLQFPLLADFEPKGKVAKSYGVYDQDKGLAERALFVINPKGIIHWSDVSPMKVNPGAEGILHALQELT